MVSLASSDLPLSKPLFNNLLINNSSSTTRDKQIEISEFNSSSTIFSNASVWSAVLGNPSKIKPFASVGF